MADLHKMYFPRASAPRRMTVTTVTTAVVLSVIASSHPGRLAGDDQAPAEIDQAPAEIDYNRDVRPILSNHCYQCHGPDEGERRAGLRLDRSSSATESLDSGHRAIVPGHPEQSELLRRVTSDDATERMPPTDSDNSLSIPEIDLLRSWIEQGGHFEQHWSHTVPVRPEVPAVSTIDWPRNPIDHFILAPLEKEGLTPAPAVDRYALARRMSLDLVGLPPTWKDVVEFANDTSPNAVSLFADRLLAKPSFGEHWARMWLDLARYADSAGYADDPHRTIWAYRDWVVRAINANVAFDQFTIDQLAGDLLANPTDDQILATAFHRNTLTNSEGGTDDEEFRNVAVVDRVNTTMAVWMGTTMACAQCHSHKFDPISQEEYFRLFAILNNTADADHRDESPVLELWSAQQDSRKVALQQRAAERQSQLDELKPAVLSQLPDWESQWQSTPNWSVITPASLTATSGTAMTLLTDGSVRVAKGDASETYTLGFVFNRNTTINALQLEALTDETLPGNGPGHSSGNFVISSIRLQAGADLPLSAAYADHSQDEFDANDLITLIDDPDRGWAIGGATGQSHVLTLLPKEPIAMAAGETLTVSIEQISKHAHHTLGRFRFRSSDDERAEELAAIPGSILSIIDTPSSSRSAEQRGELEQYRLSTAAPTRETWTELKTIQQQLAEMRPQTTVPILRELPHDQRRTTHIQRRGNFLDLAEQVTAGYPEAFHAAPTDMPINRLSLAHWLVDPANPLTARVVVNRYWEVIFGVGLVSSSEEFGARGERPSHPELLDWLATELVQQKWDTKALLRLLVTSATYGQSSAMTATQFESDPDNRRLARGPRFRLTAEMIRDQALFVSGLLADKMYGEPVRPPQPALRIRAAFGSEIDWKGSDGEDRFRRGLYTAWRRSNPYPSMAVFDAPNRNVCALRRDRTNTPLQALVTLNDPVYVEAAQALARRMVSSGLDPTEIARHGFRVATCREAGEDELTRLIALFQQARDRLAGSPDQAKQLAGEAFAPIPAELDATDLAAWTVVANVLLNLDEMFLKR